MPPALAEGKHINNFDLPPALAGGKGINLALALAKKYAILAKAIKNKAILFLQLKL
ncbi:hypothetical protein AAGV28_10120 [Flavobacterium sp. FZUC8N2.13]|uniref:Uncharacterized protein n=1 Tax=Flavobacterium zubiriense TaxID=3138075 RepID=A0ABV4TCA4_9FLAO